MAELAKCPRGRKWRSRLIPHDADIRRMIQTGATFKAIAEWICERGVTITGSGVHEYVQVRIRHGRPGYRLLSPTSVEQAAGGSSGTHLSDLEDRRADPSNGDGVPLKKEFIYRPNPPEGGLSEDEDLSFNNPLD